MDRGAYILSMLNIKITKKDETTRHEKEITSNDIASMKTCELPQSSAVHDNSVTIINPVTSESTDSVSLEQGGASHTEKYEDDTLLYTNEERSKKIQKILCNEDADAGSGSLENGDKSKNNADLSSIYKSDVQEAGTGNGIIIEEVNDSEEIDVIDSDDSMKDKNYETESDSTENDSPDEYNVSDNNEEIRYTGRPKKGRKRRYAGQDRKIRKKKCNSNQVYYTAKGQIRPEREFIDFKCTCKNKCYLKISVDDRKTFFSKYWELADYNVQTTFLSSQVTEDGVKRKSTNSLNPQKRNFSRKYTINKQVVCWDMFTKTLNISSKRVNTSLRKVHGLQILDKRGVAGGHNKMSQSQRNGVINHINKFPRYKSHYCRETRNKQEFLPIGVTLPLMYKLYKEENQNCISLSSYRKIFLTEFNLKTKLPKKDTCNKCDTYKAKSEGCTDGCQKTLLSSEHERHLQEADIARKQMENDLKAATLDENVETLTFDMEKTLPLPRLSTNIIFYKRQLWLYNCGIFAGKEKKSTFNIWLEGQAGRGSQEVGSCLRKYVKTSLTEKVNKLILWSDSCGGQNRNIKLVLMLKCILEENTSLESCQLCFLVSGHSFLPNDSDFGDVECALKKQQKLYSPQDYMDIMKKCRKKNPIRVHLMQKVDFVSTSKIERDITNRKKDINNEKINWLNIREIEVVKEKPHSVFIKNTHSADEEYWEIDIKKRHGGRLLTNKNNVFFTTSLKMLWPDGKSVAQPKLDDIQSYMHLIPEADQGFYKNLIGDPSIEEDIDGFNGPLDFEVEDD